MEGPLREVLSEQERQEISLGLLREWWMTATQAFVDTVGSEVAITSLRPHMVNAGKAAAHIFKQVTGIDDPFVQLQSAGRSMEEMFRGSWDVPQCPSEGDLRKCFRNCITAGSCEAFCISLCMHCVCSRFNELEPSWNMRLTRSLGAGDPICEWALTPFGKGVDIDRSERYIDFYRKRSPNPIPANLASALNHEYLGEFWVMTTRAFIEHSGNSKALERLSYYIRHSGMSLGIRLVSKFDNHEMGLPAIGDIVSLVNDLHRRKWTMTRGSDRIEGSVTECPFAQSALPEMCHQYCAFFNGVCDVIDPSYEFVYDRMMTNGDETCHWVIRTKGATPEGVASKDETDVLKRLATRYVMGEISKQEYEELKAILR